MSDIVNTAKQVIKIEQIGLEKLYNNLPKDFEKVCKLILNAKGKIVFTGIGKSGHIANKIVSTLSSTGTPSFFVHPAEALHGDLGMISRDDIVIAISNSGNSLELQGIYNYTQRFGIPLIGITSNKNSTLAELSDYLLLLPKAEEACILGLAPTTSTTTALVLGDALAISVLQMRGFKPEDFSVLHPGGSLGNKLLKIKQVMHKGKEIPLISYDDTMQNVLIEITSHRFGCIGILNENQNLVGIITDGDIRKNMSKNFLEQKIVNIMTKDFIYINPEDNTAKALAIMEKNKITNLFVLDNTNLVGIVHIHDLLNIGVL